MSSSTFAYSSQLVDNAGARMPQPRDGSSHESQGHLDAATPDYHHLSPLSSDQTRSTSASPTLNHTHTPAESVLSIQYQSSDFSEVDGDPFYGVDFSNIDGGTPSFLDEPLDQLGASDFFTDVRHMSYATPNGQAYHPLSPEQTPSLHTASPQLDRSKRSYDSADPEEPSQPGKPMLSTLNTATVFQLTPDTSGSRSSSEDGLAPAVMARPAQSPRVTVSMWGKDGGKPAQSLSGPVAAEPDSPTTVRGGIGGDPSRDGLGRWAPDAATGQRGLDPDHRPSGEVPSANEMATKRRVAKRNQNVDEWLAAHAKSKLSLADPASKPLPAPPPEGISDREIGLGNQTENTMQSGRTYYLEGGGPITAEDADLMRRNRNWEDAPTVFPISQPDGRRFQPQTSGEAIQKFEAMCRDTDSIVSRAATWGTRRRSLPSIADFEATSGNFLKKLSISRGDQRRPSILQELRRVVRKQPSSSQVLKRSRSNQDDEASSGHESFEESRESKNNNTLAPPNRTLSWSKKQPVPSLNTALVSMGSSIGAIGTTHARSGSVGNTSPQITSPKSPFGLKVQQLRRPRSKSDLPKASTESHPTLVDMWKKTGGPPVASLAKTSSVLDADEDDDDDDEMFEDSELKGESTKLIDDITPNFLGFQQHVLRLNPMLEQNNTYLVERIAHQQSVRYKSLLNARVKHLGHVQHRNCPCKAMCIALGGSATILVGKGDARGLDPLSSRYDGSDGDTTPLEGAIAPESFPQDIPMPPTQTLPAEFECQLCYQSKKFQKPSDWTKHVHEDVQPFTCTWDRCRDPKIFKRKADWVRHENEGHRHLEWWTCDVEDCRHTCYRRDNFLQHLVREHKFPEPKVKTKAAIKRAGGIDLTWQKVEKCHVETHERPQDEPCRFCGKSFPTWKKLTVHLAKHMEQISLPVLRLVARKELEADTIISPVHEPPPRTFAPLPIKREAHNGLSPNRTPMDHHHHGLAYGQGAFVFPPQVPQVPQVPQAAQFQAPFYTNPFSGLGGQMQSMDATAIDVPPMGSGYASHGSYPSMPVTSSGFVAAPNAFIPVPQNIDPFSGVPMNSLGLQDAPGGPMGYDGSLMDPSGAGVDPYTSQGSVSPYSHSPHQVPGPFYSHQ